MRGAISYLDWQSAVQNRGCCAGGKTVAAALGVGMPVLLWFYHPGARGPGKRYIRGKRLQSSGKEEGRAKRVQQSDEIGARNRLTLPEITLIKEN